MNAASQSRVAIIGGTGLARMPGLSITRREMVKTPFGAPSCPILIGEFGGRAVAFLARHGHQHRIPPHRINYCANLWALHSVGIGRVIAIGAVGGIARQCQTGAIVVPDQIIDYTYNRISTYSDDEEQEGVRHIDFTEPYDATLRTAVIAGARKADVTLVEDGVYGATQGPRLETAAEVQRLERDGCTLVGMTGMPEAALARELDIAYACCAVVVNPAAGKAAGPIDMDALGEAVHAGMQSAQSVIGHTLEQLGQE